MSVWSKAASVVGAAAVLLSGGPALANNPNGGGPQHGPTQPPPPTCKSKPNYPRLPLAAGAPNCCIPPKVWQTNFSGGLNGAPQKYFWICAPRQTPPK